MTDLPELPVLTREDLDARIIAAFLHLYPDLSPSRLTVGLNDANETITIWTDDDRLPGFRASILSDDDGYLYFTPFDEDDAPEDDDHDFLTIRIRVLNPVREA